MRHMISMTGTLKGYVDGEVELADLKLGTFYFGCASEHLGPDPEHVPYEATWQNTELPSVYDPEHMADPNHALVSLDKVDAGMRDRVQTFCALVREADEDHRVHWKVGNYPDLVSKLARAAHAARRRGRIWYQGSWRGFNEIRKTWKLEEAEKV